MPAKSSIAIRNAQLDAVSPLLAGGVLRIYSGPQPANVAAAATGTLLATLTLGTPAFAPAYAGAITATDITPEPSATAGTAGWFRLYQSAGLVAHYDGDITAPGGGGIIQLDPVTISAGAPVALSSLTITLPE